MSASKAKDAVLFAVVSLFLSTASQADVGDCILGDLLVGNLRGVNASAMSASRATLHSPNQAVVVSWEGVTLYDPRTGKATQVPGYSELRKSSNGERGLASAMYDGEGDAYYINNDQPPSLINFDTGKIRQIPALKEVDFSFAATGDGQGAFMLGDRALVGTKAGTELVIYDIESDKVKILPLPATASSGALLRDRDEALIFLEDHSPVLINVRTREMRQLSIPWEGGTATLDLIPGQSRVIISRYEELKAPSFKENTGDYFENLVQKYYLLNLDPPGLQALPAPPNTYSIVISPDGRYVAPNGPNYLAFGSSPPILDLTTGMPLRINNSMFEGKFSPYHFSEDSRFLIGSGSTKNTFLFSLDLQTGKTQTVQFHPHEEGAFVGHSPENNSAFILATKYGDEMNDYRVSYRLLEWDFRTGKTTEIRVPFPIQDGRIVEGSRAYFGSLNGRAAHIDLTRWSDLTQKSTLTRIPRARPDRTALLSKRASEGNLRIATDLPLIFDYFKSGSYRHSPGSLLPVLYSVAGESDLLYHQLLRYFPDALEIGQKQLTTVSPLTPAEIRRLGPGVTDYINRRFEFLKTDSPTRLADWEDLALLRPFLEKLPVGQVDNLVTDISKSISTGFMLDAPEGFFEPVVIKAISQRVKQFFGQKGQKLTDLTIVREAERVRPFLVSVLPIDGDVSTATDYGFYMRELPEIAILENLPPGAALTDQTIRWGVGSDIFEARFKVNAHIRPITEALPITQAPDYAGMWKDDQLTGLITVGENWRHKTDINDEYIEYYLRQDFKFDRNPIKVTDMKAFIEEKVRSGEIDYWMKEAHADGDERNLFRIFQTGSLKRGEKRLSDGKREVVYIFEPNQDNPTLSQLIPNNEFGSWVQARESAKKGPILYFGNSCFGMDKACRELEAAYSPLLTVIGTPHTATTFVASRSSPTYQLLDGFRQGKTWAEIDKALKNTSAYANGKGNYVFPNSELFQTEIRNKITRPVKIDIQIKDGRGRPYAIDQITETL